jgi:hypothetical protein
MRQALATLLSQRRARRAQAALRLAAEALASDADACAEAQAMAAEFLVAENEALAGAEAPANATSKPCGCRSPRATACCASAGRWPPDQGQWPSLMERFELSRHAAARADGCIQPTERQAQVDGASA